MLAFYHDKISPVLSKIFQSIKLFLSKSLKFIVPVSIVLFILFPTTMFQFVGALGLLIISGLVIWFSLKFAINILLVFFFGSFYVICGIIAFVLAIGGLAWVFQLFS